MVKRFIECTSAYKLDTLVAREGRVVLGVHKEIIELLSGLLFDRFVVNLWPGLNLRFLEKHLG